MRLRARRLGTGEGGLEVGRRPLLPTIGCLVFHEMWRRRPRLRGQPGAAVPHRALVR